MTITVDPDKPAPIAEAVAGLVAEHYVFPEIGLQLSEMILAKSATGQYDAAKEQQHLRKC